MTVMRPTPRRRTVLLLMGLVVPTLALAGFAIVQLDSRDADPASADILNPHPAAGPFDPDGTRLEDCATASDSRRRCFEQAFGNIAYHTSGKEALALMDERGAVESEIKAGCHRIAHTIGAAALARKDGNVGSALADGDSTCWSGFYHGLLERALAPARSSEELATLIGTLCNPAEQDWPPFTHYQCLHGLGHGLMLRTGYALDASLDMCTRLLDQWSRQSCDGGVFMESFSPSLTDEPPPFDASDPLAPCPRVAENHKLYCYLQVADNLVRGTGYDWARIADACNTEAVTAWRAICFQGYGRQASGTNYGRPASVAKLCSVAGPVGQADCVYGAARDIASNAAGGGPAATFCRLLGRGLVGKCFEGVGTILATLDPSPPVVRRACASLTATHRSACLRGAGVAS